MEAGGAEEADWEAQQEGSPQDAPMSDAPAPPPAAALPKPSFSFNPSASSFSFSPSAASWAPPAAAAAPPEGSAPVAPAAGVAEPAAAGTLGGRGRGGARRAGQTTLNLCAGAEARRRRGCPGGQGGCAGEEEEGGGAAGGGLRRTVRREKQGRASGGGGGVGGACWAALLAGFCVLLVAPHAALLLALCGLELAVDQPRSRSSLAGAHTLGSPGPAREHVNLVFIGHVDAGKSTIGGQILFLTARATGRPWDAASADAAFWLCRAAWTSG